MSIVKCSLLHDKQYGRQTEPGVRPDLYVGRDSSADGSDGGQQDCQEVLGLVRLRADVSLVGEECHQLVVVCRQHWQVLALQS